MEKSINYDVYRQSRNLELQFGGLTSDFTSEVSFADFINEVLNNVITNSNSSRYYKTYFDLETLYNEYITNTNFVPYNFTSLTEFINKMSPYWIQILEQFIPATTLWSGGNLIENNIFNRSKYTYLKPRYGVDAVNRDADNYQCG